MITQLDELDRREESLRLRWATEGDRATDAL
jgi:hypothetical protein